MAFRLVETAYQAYGDGMDPETLRKVAKLARSRARPPRHHDRRDGLERLGAERALRQLAEDLEVSARFCGEQGED